MYIYAAFNFTHETTEILESAATCRDVFVFQWRERERESAEFSAIPCKAATAARVNWIAEQQQQVKILAKNKLHVISTLIHVLLFLFSLSLSLSVEIFVRVLDFVLARIYTYKHAREREKSL